MPLNDYDVTNPVAPFQDVMNGQPNNTKNNLGYMALKGAQNLREDGFMTKLFNGGKVKQDEYFANLLTTMYQNEWNSEGERMQRLIDAGVNPYIAAQGVAGASGSGAGMPVSTDSGESAVQAASGAVSNLAGAYNSAASGKSTLAQLPSTIDNLTADTELKLGEVLKNSAETKSIMAVLPYLKYAQIADIMVKVANFDNLRAEYENILETHNKILADIELIRAKEGEANANKASIDEHTRWTMQQNDFFAMHNYAADASVDVSLRNSVVSGNKEQANQIGESVYQYYTGVEKAKAEQSWNYRPSNAYEATMWAADNIKKFLSTSGNTGEQVKTTADLYNLLKQDRTAEKAFNEGYKEAKDELYSTYVEMKRQYKYFKRAGNPQTAAQYENKMNNAKKEYEEFTKEKYSSILVSQIGNPANTNFDE